MSKPEITIFDKNFGISKATPKEKIGIAFSSFHGQSRYPKEFTWNRDTSKITDLCVFTDSCIKDARTVNCKYKIAWILEPKAWDERPYKYLSDPNNRKIFDLILSHELDFLNEINETSKDYYYPSYGASIKDDDFNIYEKTKNLTLPMSFKKMTAGHRLRHSILKNHENFGFSGLIDFYVRGYNLFDALRDYRFSITIENTLAGSLSEKITTAFLCGTIPIYYGSPRVGEFFDNRGFYTFSNEFELYKILDKLNGNFEEIYESKLPFVKNNFEIAKEKYMIDDILWEKHFKKYF